MVKLGEVALEIKSGFACGTSDDNSAGVPHFRPMNISTDGLLVWVGTKYISEDFFADKSDYLLRAGDVLFNNTNSKELVGKTCLVDREIRAGYSNHLTRIRLDLSKMMPQLLALLLHEKWRKGEFLNLCNKWVGQAGVNNTLLASVEIPLPPLEEQERIVAELDGCRNVIEGARQVLASYKPTIKIDPTWPVKRLSEVSEINRETVDPIIAFAENSFTYLDISSVENGTGRVALTNQIESAKAPSRARRVIQNCDVLLSTVRPNLKAFAYLENLPERVLASTGFAVLTPLKGLSLGKFLWFMLFEDASLKQMTDRMEKGAYPSINQTDVEQIEIPLPPLDIQREIVVELEAEQALVEANRKLIEVFEKKIQAKLAEIWGEE
jgi:type I restriction enzyme M protein